MTYKFKNFKFDCEDDEYDEDHGHHQKTRSWDYDEFLRMDMKSTAIFKFFHRERGFMKQTSDKPPKIFDDED